MVLLRESPGKLEEYHQRLHLALLLHSPSPFALCNQRRAAEALIQVPRRAPAAASSNAEARAKQEVLCSEGLRHLSSSLPHWGMRLCQKTLPVSVKITPAPQTHLYLIFEVSVGSCGYTKQSGSGLEHPGGRAFPTARYQALSCSPISSLHDSQHRSWVLTWEFILLWTIPLMTKS